MESGNEGLISKTARPTNARKKALAMALKVYHLLLQNLNPRINSINSEDSVDKVMLNVVHHTPQHP